MLKTQNTSLVFPSTLGFLIILLMDICVAQTVSDINGNVYKTVKIGDQLWMVENLRVNKYNNGDNIPGNLSNEDWSNTKEGAYAIYPHEGGYWDEGPIEGINSDEEMVASYGKLYNWFAIDDPRGLCPQGWSIPDSADWSQLVNYLMNEYDYDNLWLISTIDGVGNALKSCHQVKSPLDGCNTSQHPRWNSDSIHSGFNQVGFSALPGGIRRSEGRFDGIGYVISMWSASEDDIAWSQRIYYNSGHIAQRNSWFKSDGYSVRCFRNIE